jgi:hypothetical protein
VTGMVTLLAIKEHDGNLLVIASPIKEDRVP